jgi:transcriptional regulator with XRE-family HTH domain
MNPNLRASLPVECRDIAGAIPYILLINKRADSRPMKVVTPDGAKIIELRKAKNMYQKVLGSKVGLSERTIRDLENKNKPISEFKLVNIATALGVNVEELKDKQTDTSGQTNRQLSTHQVELNKVASARDFYDECKTASHFDWKFHIDPSMHVASLIDETLRIVKRLVKGDSQPDDFDNKYTYTDPFRVARLGELIDELGREDVNILANTYYRVVSKYADGDDNNLDDLESQRCVYIDFTPKDRNSEVVFVWRGSKYEEYASKYYLDDDIPF